MNSIAPTKSIYTIENVCFREVSLWIYVLRLKSIEKIRSFYQNLGTKVIYLF